MTCLALDIGGANIKAADGAGWARSRAFPLWKNQQGLAPALIELIESAPPCERLAVTMTGELCDCYTSKAEGVRHILDAVCHAAGTRDVQVYLVDGRSCSVAEAQHAPLLAAASNWRALAEFAGRFLPGGTGLLIDVGSTTTDIVPLIHGRVVAKGRTDTERLLAGELLYSGVGRTPVCAVTDRLPWRGRPCRVAAEVFSTTADAHLLLGNIPEESDANWTADGRPLTADFARQRLARQLCADASDLSRGELQELAAAVASAQLAKLTEAVGDVFGSMAVVPHAFILSGAGEFLARQVVPRVSDGGKIVSLTGELGPEVSRCAPAHALAMLASEK